MITIIWVWHCVAYGQLPVHSPYHIPYISTFVTPHKHQNYDESILGRDAGELLERNSPFQGAIFVKMKKLEAISANLAKQLKGIKTKWIRIYWKIHPSLNIVFLTVSDITAKLEKNVLDLKDELNSEYQ